MKIIIAGGTGLIGRALAASLAGAGHEVIVLSRQPERASTLRNVVVHAWDACTPGNWGGLIDKETIIVNLAGENVGGRCWSRRQKVRIARSRVDAGRAVLAAVAAAEAKPRAVLQASAVGYYGSCGDKAITETHPAGTDFLAEVCLQAEASTAPVQELGVRWVALRTGVVLSRNGGALPVMVKLFRLGLGGRLGDGRQWFPWIHIEDAVAAIEFLMEHESAAGPFNLSSFDPVRNRHFVRLLARFLKRPAFFHVPSPVLRCVLGEMSSMLLSSQRAVPRRLLEMGFRFRFPEPGAALRDLLGTHGSP